MIHQVSVTCSARSRLCSHIQMRSFIHAASRCKLLSDMLDAPSASLHNQTGQRWGGRRNSPREDISIFHRKLFTLQRQRPLKENCFIHKGRQPQETLSGDKVKGDHIKNLRQRKNCLRTEENVHFRVDVEKEKLENCFFCCFYSSKYREVV